MLFSHLSFCCRVHCLWRPVHAEGTTNSAQAPKSAFYTYICTLFAVCIIPGYFQTLFASMCIFSSVPLLKMLLQQREPWAPRRPFTFLLRALTLVNQKLLLAEMSATIKESPVGRVMLLKGFACLLEAGSGDTLGCHMCQPGMRQNSLECPWILELTRLSETICLL